MFDMTHNKRWGGGWWGGCLVAYDSILFVLSYVARVRFGIRVRMRVRVRQDSAIKKLLKIFLFIFSIYFYY